MDEPDGGDPHWLTNLGYLLLGGVVMLALAVPPLLRLLAWLRG